MEVTQLRSLLGEQDRRYIVELVAVHSPYIRSGTFGLGPVVPCKHRRWRRECQIFFNQPGIG